MSIARMAHLTYLERRGLFEIHYASRKNDTETIKRLLQETPVLLKRPDRFCDMLPIHFAAQKANVEALRLFISLDENKKTLEKRDCLGNTPLMLAVFAIGDVEETKRLRAIRMLLSATKGKVEAQRVITGGVSWINIYKLSSLYDENLRKRYLF